MAKGRRQVPPVTPRRDGAGDPVLPVPRPPRAGRFPRGPIPGHEPSPGTSRGARAGGPGGPAPAAPPAPPHPAVPAAPAGPPASPAGAAGTARAPGPARSVRGGGPVPSLPRRRPVTAARATGRTRGSRPVLPPPQDGSGPGTAASDRAGTAMSDRAGTAMSGRTGAAKSEQDGARAASERARARALAEHPAGGRRAEPGAPWYRARPGDGLRDLAPRLGVSPEELARVNGSAPDAPLVPGQRVFLPLQPGDAGPPDGARPRGTRGKVLTHVLARGETLESVAEQHGVNAGLVRLLNRIDPSTRLRPGRRVVLPAPRPPRPVLPSSRPHTVRPQETLAGIALATGTELDRILELNELAAGEQVRPGLRILLPADPRDRSPGAPPRAVLAAAAANRAALARRPRVPSGDVRAGLARIAPRFGVDVPLALAVAYEESRFDQRRVSDANAVGVMQLVPSCGAWACRVLARDLDLLDATDNITAGVALLAVLLRSGDQAGSIAAYYQGAASVRTEGPLPDTLGYVSRVRRLRDRFAGIH